MIERIICFALLASIGTAGPAADWRAELVNYIGAGKADALRGAAGFLDGQFGSLSDEDKPVACGLLAYLHGRLGDKNSEYQRLGEYFEKYGAVDLGFSFLPVSTRNSVLRYLREWQLRYPWVLKIGLVSPGGAGQVTPAANSPETILLGIEMASDVYYKLTDGQNILRGGELHRGFNSIALESRRVFREPGAFPYVLEFKAGDLVVRRELVLAVQMDYQGVLGKSAVRSSDDSFILEMFFGQELLASSRKTVLILQDMKVDVPPPSGKYDPFGPGYQNEPRIPRGVPIMAVPQAILEAIKALKKKDEVEPVPPVELKTEMAFSFKRLNAGGEAVEVTARVSLGLKEMRFLPYSLMSGSRGPQ
jgi:hypothetical protein